MGHSSILLKIVSEREEFFDEVAQEKDIRKKAWSLLGAMFVAFAIYGGIIGAPHSLAQAAVSAMKLPVLYLLTLIICFPTLFIFNTLFGSKQTLGQYFVILLSTVAVTSLLLIAFAPITLFFMLTADHYQFFKLLNVGIFAIAGFIGVGYFYKGMLHFSTEDKKAQKTVKRLLALWILLYAFVGSQLAWTIRPFFGSEGSPFSLFRELGGNFYTDIIAAISEVLGFK